MRSVSQDLNAESETRKLLKKLSELSRWKIVWLFWSPSFEGELEADSSGASGQSITFVLFGFILPIICKGFFELCFVHSVIALVQPAIGQLPVSFIHPVA